MGRSQHRGLRRKAQIRRLFLAVFPLLRKGGGGCCGCLSSQESGCGFKGTAHFRMGLQGMGRLDSLRFGLCWVGRLGALRTLCTVCSSQPRNPGSGSPSRRHLRQRAMLPQVGASMLRSPLLSHQSPHWRLSQQYPLLLDKAAATRSGTTPRISAEARPTLQQSFRERFRLTGRWKLWHISDS